MTRLHEFPLLAALALHGVAAVDYGVSHTDAPGALCPVPTELAWCALELSTTGELLRLVREEKAAGTTRVVARSYDGELWEALFPEPVSVLCADDSVCSFEWDPDVYAFSMRRTTVTAPTGNTHHATARLFGQATFGGRLEDVAAFDAAGGSDPAAAGAWFDAQSGADALLMTAYVRQRMNAQVMNNPVQPPGTRPGGKLPLPIVRVDAYDPCDIGSRWHRYAFSARDMHQELTVTERDADGVFELWLYGQLVTEVPAAQWPAGEGAYRICGVGHQEGTEDLGAEELVLSSQDNEMCAKLKKDSEVVTMPAVLIANETRANVWEPADGAVTFDRVAGRGGDGEMRHVMLLEENNDAGCLGLPEGAEVMFLKRDGELWRFDRRARLYENTIENPNTEVGRTSAPGGDRCLSARMTVFNEDHCVANGACAAVACGARGEVGNDPHLGHRYSQRQEPRRSSTQLAFEFDGAHTVRDSKTMAFHNIALYADDQQLRYRVAWALFQIMPINELSEEQDCEMFPKYMDMFVANAFGNYRDVLREVSYSAHQGMYLTFLNSRSYAAQASLPDQNYAREIMQLFSIGLAITHQNGTIAAPQQATYDTKDIVTFARAWTGFENAPARGGVEQRKFSYNDPMVINGTARDAFPKLDLFDQYIGDRYPLCSDLPRQHFLMKGAKYVYHGAEPLEGDEFTAAAEAAGLGHYAPPAESQLYIDLCAAATEGGACEFRAVAKLPSRRTCHASDMACPQLDDVTTVKIVTGGVAHYYAYVKPACVKLALFAGQEVFLDDEDASARQCADPSVPVAGVACCNADGTINAASQCKLAHERVAFATMETRCSAAGLQVCDAAAVVGNVGFATACAPRQAVWAAAPCRLEVQVWEDGAVGLVAPGMDDPRLQPWTMNTFYPNWAGGRFPTALGTDCATRADGMLVCNVEFERTAVFSAAPSMDEAMAQLAVGAFSPTAYDGEYTCQSGCEADAEVSVWTKGGGAVDTSTIIGVKVPAAEMWHSGDADGYQYYRNVREVVKMDEFEFRNAPTFMPLSGEMMVANEDMMVERVDMGRPVYNMTVPPQRKVPAFAAEYAARHETEALLDHLFFHPNAPAFIAKLMIQRLVTSNPSPRYIQVVADAYATGKYPPAAPTGRGSGRYGCMTALLAAVLLDREARSLTLDADPGHGAMREPLLKVLKVMRSQGLATRGHEARVGLRELGQEVFDTPSIFGFYLPTFIPAGPLEDAGLTSPETELAVAPLMFDMMNRLGSLVHNGLSAESYSVANGDVGSVGDLAMDPAAGVTGWPTPALAEAVLSKLDLTLADGRLAAATRSAILAEVAPLLYESSSEAPEVDRAACFGMGAANSLEVNCTRGSRCVDAASNAWKPPRGCVKDGGEAVMENDASAPCCVVPDMARARLDVVKALRELVLFAPEFHVTNLRAVRAARGTSEGGMPRRGDAGYKAVVMVNMKGGADSWNHLIPAEGCEDGATFEAYARARGAVAVERDDVAEFMITPDRGNAPSHSPTQPCASFYISNELSSIAEMFNAGDAAAFPNIGNMIHPFTSAEKATAAYPEHQSSHNFGQRHLQTLWPQVDETGKGVLGRLADGLKREGLKANVYGVSEYPTILRANDVMATVLDYREGVKGLAAIERYPVSALENILSDASASLFAETYALDLLRGMGISLELRELISVAKSDSPVAVKFKSDYFAKQLETIATIMRLRHKDTNERLADRDFFASDVKGFDTHAAMYQENIPPMNDALALFKEELIAQGVWADTVVAVVSEFGRTLQSNGRGTDHGWGGHYFALGGAILDRVMLSQYPESLAAGNTQDWGNGIFIPKWGYEVLWGPVSDWVGLSYTNRGYVLPNHLNFNYTCACDLFETPEGGKCECGDAPELPPTPGPPTPPPLEPLGAFTPVCDAVSLDEAVPAGSAVKALSYTMGHVANVAAVLFRMTLQGSSGAPSYGAVGLRAVAAEYASMAGLDIVAVDTTARSQVYNFDVSVATQKPMPAPQDPGFLTALADRGADGDVTVVSFYRLLDNGVDFTLPSDGTSPVNVAVAAGPGAVGDNSWGMHAAWTRADVALAVCGDLATHVTPAPPGTPSPSGPGVEASASASVSDGPPLVAILVPILCVAVMLAAAAVLLWRRRKAQSMARFDEFELSPASPAPIDMTCMEALEPATEADASASRSMYTASMPGLASPRTLPDASAPFLQQAGASNPTFGDCLKGDRL